MSDLRPIALVQRLPADEDAPKLARRLAAQVLQRLGSGQHRAEDLGLIVSELVTNAVLHGPAGDVVLRMRATDELIRLEVTDGGTNHFAWPTNGTDGHWGLALVGMLSERCGIIRHPATVVWCELDLA